jgi:hypothetical protein
MRARTVSGSGLAHLSAAQLLITTTPRWASFVGVSSRTSESMAFLARRRVER